LAQRDERHEENQMKGCAAELKVSDCLSKPRDCGVTNCRPIGIGSRSASRVVLALFALARFLTNRARFNRIVAER